MHPGLSGEALHPGVEEEEVLRLRGWIREVLGFHRALTNHI